MVRLKPLAAAALVGVPLMAMQSSREFVNVGVPPGLPFSGAVKAGGLIYVSGTLATGANDAIVAGGIGAQTRQVLDNISAVLKAAGSGLDRAVSVHVYLKRAADFGAMNDVYRTYWPADPPVRTTVEADLVLPDALIEISMVAVPAGAERRVIHPPAWARSANPYSYGIRSGDTLFLAGLVSRNNRDNTIVAGDLGTQTRTVLDNAGEVLAAAGMTHADVVSSRVYITDVAGFQDMNAAYRTYFPKDPPARATVRSGLMGSQYSVEITLVAVQGSDRQAIVPPAADGAPARPNPNLSPAIRVGSRLYVSGMLGNTEANAGDVNAQTRETLARIGRTLTAAGFEWNHVVDGVVYLTDLGQFQGMNGAYREIFTRDFPTRATVHAGLVAPDGLVEIMFVAVK